MQFLKDNLKKKDSNEFVVEISMEIFASIQKELSEEPLNAKGIS